MSQPEITPEMFEGLKFDERVKLRRELIAKYGTSLPKGDEPSKLFGDKHSGVKDASGNELPVRGDLKAFEDLKFEERVQIREKMIAAYGSSLPEADVEQGTTEKKKEDLVKSNFG